MHTAGLNYHPLSNHWGKIMGIKEIDPPPFLISVLSFPYIVIQQIVIKMTTSISSEAQTKLWMNKHTNKSFTADIQYS